MKIKNKIKYELIMGVIFEKICKIIYINYNILIKKHFIIKFLLFVIISLLIQFYNINIKQKKFRTQENYIQIQKDINFTFHFPIKKKINLGIYAFCIKNGGRARSTSLLIYYLYNITIFNIYLFTRRIKEENEYIY